MSELKKILILALGGEGGGTLTEWVVNAGLAHRWPIQATSIPGVAQRTGATSYYIECLAQELAANEVAPPMCLAPLAGDLDLVISSELLETARAVERGLCDRERTVIISSTTRALTVGERTAMGDARLDSAVLSNGIRSSGKSVSLLDLTELARKEGTVVSAVMFGALVASKVLPFAREVCEQVIAGKGGDTGNTPDARTQASLNGFSAGFAAVSKDLSQPNTANLAPNELHKPALSVEAITELGAARLTDFQDQAYANQYREIVASLIKNDQAPFTASKEAARGLALWMAYEDVIRVADLKSRRSRFEQIRIDYKAKDTEPVIVRDFLKPGIDEIAAILPPKFATALLAWAKKRGIQTIGEGMQMNTSSVFGLLCMRLLANLRFIRRRSSRFQIEQRLIQHWVSALQQALDRSKPNQSTELASAIAELPRLIKGYGDTFARGRGNFERILSTLVLPSISEVSTTKNLNTATDLAAKIQAAIKAALANPDGNELYRVLGLNQPAPKEHVIKFARPVSRPR
jgi:indolepyruvate ferredoxin oxidoreductase, beta subunit